MSQHLEIMTKKAIPNVFRTKRILIFVQAQYMNQHLGLKTKKAVKNYLIRVHLVFVSSEHLGLKTKKAIRKSFNTERILVFVEAKGWCTINI